MPRRLDQNVAQMAVAGLGDAAATLPARSAGAVFAGHSSGVAEQLPGLAEAQHLKRPSLRSDGKLQRLQPADVLRTIRFTAITRRKSFSQWELAQPIAGATLILFGILATAQQIPQPLSRWSSACFWSCAARTRSLGTCKRTDSCFLHAGRASSSYGFRLRRTWL